MGVVYGLNDLQKSILVQLKKKVLVLNNDLYFVVWYFERSGTLVVLQEIAIIESRCLVT